MFPQPYIHLHEEQEMQQIHIFLPLQFIINLAILPWSLHLIVQYTSSVKVINKVYYTYILYDQFKWPTC